MTTYSRSKHAEFLDAELAAQIQQFQHKLETSAVNLLENGDLFVAQFLKLNDQGQMILKFNTELRSTPRKGDYLRAMIVREGYQSYKAWGGITYGNLIKLGQLNYSEIVSIWQHKSDDPRYTLVAFNGLDMEFAKALVPGCIVIVGPQEPPVEYLINLRKLVLSIPSDTPFGQILDIDPESGSNDWQPTPIENNSQLILQQVLLTPSLIIQGPPGSGKTTLISEIIVELLDQGKRVMVTALTNRALMELACKPALAVALQNKQIFKAALKWDEKIELPSLQGCSELYSAPSTLTLATFYVASHWAQKEVPTEAYDIVIVDEASQALLAMVAASKLLAPKSIWVGDPAQLPPVVVLPNDEIAKRKAWHWIDGMSTITSYLAIPSYQITCTYRLPPRAAELTGLFYRNTLRSKVTTHPNFIPTEIPIPYRNWLHPEGGPVLHLLTLSAGDPAPKELLFAVVCWVSALVAHPNKEQKIVILSKLRKTVGAVQRAIAQTIDGAHNIQVDTVERVQGLTCDICLFLLPDAHLSMGLNQKLFNVATSRAKYHTVIIASDHILRSVKTPEVVGQYLSKLPRIMPDGTNFGKIPSCNYPTVPE